MRRWLPAFMAFLAFAGGGTARGGELPLDLLLMIAPRDGAGPRPAAMSVPGGWAAGDAAAVLLAGPDADPAMRESLRAALLADGTAVLERRPARCDDTLLPWLAAASEALRREQGAGLMLQIGLGCAGGAVLRAVDAFASGGEVVASVAILGGDAAFAPGLPPAPEEAWGRRAPILCRLVAAATGIATAEAHCRAGLLPLAPRIAGR